jgi:uncharacterized protein
MTPLNLDENQATYQIRAFKPGTIQINDKMLTQSLIISADQLIENWAPQTISELSAAALAQIPALKPDILLIGTGTTHVLIPVEIYGELINQGIGVEIMDTSAACRTFNALTAENRNVVAALIIK